MLNIVVKMEAKAQISVNCYHCGDDCAAEHIVFQGKNFCCSGCKMVYDVLQQNNLCTYYSIENNPGNTEYTLFDASKYEYLELPEVESSLISFKEGSTVKVNFFIPKIHCSSCIWLLENLQKLNTGINFSRVNFNKKEVAISFNNDFINLRKVVELLAKIGYEPQITLSDSSKGDNDSNTSNQYIKLGIVGFCFGNMMLISFPEYISFGQYIETNFKDLFNILNLGFSIPVLYIAIKEYIIPSIKSLKLSQLSIDVPISIGIIALFLSSLYEISILGNAGYLDSFGGLIFFLLLGKIFQEKTYDSLSFDRDFKSYFPISVYKLENGQSKPTTLKNLEIGDQIIIHHQELIPVDAYLKKGDAMVDYSFITGESEPVQKLEGDLLYAGGKQVGGNIELIVDKKFNQSELIDLWNGDVFSKNHQSSFDELTNKVSKYFTIAVLTIAIGSLLFWLPQQSNIALKAFVSVLIVACPCALALSSPFALGSLLRVFGKGKLFLKNALVSERLSRVDTIVFDKTGTLTNTDSIAAEYHGISLKDSELDLISSLASHSLHPLSKQLTSHLSGRAAVEFDDFEEVIGNGIKGNLKGLEIKLGRKSFVAPDLILNEMNDNRGSVFVSIGGIYKGQFLFNQVYRQGVDSQIIELRKNYDLYVLSGDNDSEKNKLREWFGDDSTLKFNQTPKSKLEFIDQLKQQNKTVLMVGDGLNDAGALKTADVGIALTDNITSFSPSNDGILDASVIKNLGKYLKISKAGMQVIKASFLISIMYNLIGLSFAVQGMLTPVLSAILMPLSSITVVVFATGTVGLIAKYYKI